VLESIPWAAIGGLTPHGLLMLVVVLILTGKLVPKSTYDVMRDQKTYWRKAAEELRETNHIQTRTIEKQEITGETVRRVMEAVQAANHAKDGGDT